MAAIDDLSLEELNGLYEAFYVAIGPRRIKDEAMAQHNIQAARSLAAALTIRQADDPDVVIEDTIDRGPVRERWKLYPAYDSVDKYVLAFGDSGHLRLDVRRGLITIDGDAEVGHLALQGGAGPPPEGDVLGPRFRAGASLDDLNLLYEDYYVGIGTRWMADRTQALRNLDHIRAIAAGMTVRQIIDPKDQKYAGGGVLASKRYKLYAEADSVDKFIMAHREGGHLRLDVQRGNIEIKGDAETGHIALLS